MNDEVRQHLEENFFHLMMEVLLELVELLKIFEIYENEDLVNVLMMDFEEIILI
jgi:hypothetical protein